MFVFACFYIVIPQVVNKADENKTNINQLDIINENKEYNLKLNYPYGDKIRLVKNSEFYIGDFIVICDESYGEISNYDYVLNINGKRATSFTTDSCGGFYINAEIVYKNTKLFGELLVIVEERQ